MTWEEKSAIIGFWRSGATSTEIQMVTGVPAYHVELIIKEYRKSIGEIK